MTDLTLPHQRMTAAFGRAGRDNRASFELQENVEIPSIEGLPSGTVLIQTLAASICGTDLCGKGQDWRKPLDYLTIVTQDQCCGGTGHELIGKVVRGVEPLQKVQIGRVVLAMSPLYIRNMRPLARNFEQATGSLASSMLPLHGGFSQYFISHETFCIDLPATVPSPQWKNPFWYVAAQPLGTILHSCRKLESVIGQNVAIVGQGQNGLMMTQLLARQGARRVIALDLFETRLNCAKQMGATHVIQVPADFEIAAIQTQVHDITQGGMCDVVVEMVGHQHRTIDLCAQLTRSEGTVLLFGLPPARDEAPMAIRSRDFVRNLRYVTCSSPDVNMFRLAMELLEQGRFDPTPLFTHTIPFADFSRAYDMAYNYEDGVIKILVTFEA